MPLQQCNVALKYTQLSYKNLYASRHLFLIENMPVKSILTHDVNIICLYQLLLVKTAIATDVEILNIQYLQTVVAHRSVVNAETPTDLLIDLTINIDIEWWKVIL